MTRIKNTYLLTLAGHFVVAVLVCTVLGSIVQTQFNLAGLQQLGVPMPLDVRAEATAADLLGFTPSLAPIVLLGYLIALPIAARLTTWRPAKRRVWYFVAGATAIFTAMTLMAVIFAVTPVAAARGPVGMAALCLCGAIGALVFQRLRKSVQRSALAHPSAQR